MERAHIARVRRVVLGLGSNLGDRAENLQRAIARLREAAELGVETAASVYESPPAGGPPQGDYYNSAVLARTALDPHAVSKHAFAIETAFGRTRRAGERNEPRVLDIDVLWIEGEIIDEAGLVVPHPRLLERVFALRPLLDVAPDATDPRTGLRYADAPSAREAIQRVG